MRIENTKHPLIQLTEEFLQGHFQIHVSILVVSLKVFEKVCEDVRVSFVQNPVGFLEHKVEISLGVRQELCEEVWKKEEFKLDLMA